MRPADAGDRNEVGAHTYEPPGGPGAGVADLLSFERFHRSLLTAPREGSARNFPPKASITSFFGFSTTRIRSDVPSRCSVRASARSRAAPQPRVVSYSNRPAKSPGLFNNRIRSWFASSHDLSLSVRPSRNGVQQCCLSVLQERTASPKASPSSRSIAQSELDLDSAFNTRKIVRGQYVNARAQP